MQNHSIIIALLLFNPVASASNVTVEIRDRAGGGYNAVVTAIKIDYDDVKWNSQGYDLAHFNVPVGMGGQHACISSTNNISPSCTRYSGGMCYGANTDVWAYAKSLIGREMLIHNNGWGGSDFAIIACGRSYVHGIAVIKKPPTASCTWSGTSDFTHPAAVVGGRIEDVTHAWTISCSGSTATTVTVTTAPDIALKSESGGLASSSMSVGRAGVFRETLNVRGTSVVDIISSVRGNITKPGTYTGSSVLIAEWD